MGIIFNNMRNILLQIADIAENESISIGALERKIGASKGVLSRAIANNTDIQSKWIQIIVENYPHYSTDWIITGNGSMLKDGIIEEKKEIPLKIVDKDSIGFILDRYESLAAENALLKRENEELKLLIDKPGQSIPYTDNSLNLGTNIAAEPKNK